MKKKIEVRKEETLRLSYMDLVTEGRLDVRNIRLTFSTRWYLFILLDVRTLFPVLCKQASNKFVRNNFTLFPQILFRGLYCLCLSSQSLSTDFSFLVSRNKQRVRSPHFPVLRIIPCLFLFFIYLNFCFVIVFLSYTCSFFLSIFLVDGFAWDCTVWFNWLVCNYSEVF